MDSQPVSTDVFNGFLTIEEQTTVSQEHLVELGSLFVLHGLHGSFAAGLLHRHQDLPENHGLVHEKVGDEDFCRPIVLTEVARLSPHSYFVNAEGYLQPYQFQVGPSQIQMTDAFARDFSSLLQSRSLTAVVSVVPRPEGEGEGTISLETLLPDGGGMHTARYKAEDVHIGADEEDVTTAWVFDVDADGLIGVTRANRCVKYTNGIHQRTYQRDKVIQLSD